MYFIFIEFFGSQVSVWFVQDRLLNVSLRSWFLTIILLNFLSTFLSTLSFNYISHNVYMYGHVYMSEDAFGE